MNKLEREFREALAFVITYGTGADLRLLREAHREALLLEAHSFPLLERTPITTWSTGADVLD